MKYLILFITLFIIQYSFAQSKNTPQAMYATDIDEQMYSATLISNNSILAVHTANMFKPVNTESMDYIAWYSQFQETNTDTSFSVSNVSMSDFDLNQLHSRDFTSNTDTFRLVLDAIEDTVLNEIAILVGYLTKDVQSQYLLFTDYELNTKRITYVNKYNFEDYNKGIILQKDLLSHQYNIANYKKLYRINKEGDISQYHDWGGTPYYSYLIPLINGQFLFGNSNSQLRVLDNSLAVDSTYAFQTNTEKILSICTPKLVKPLNKNYVYMAGKTNIIDTDEIAPKDALIRIVINEPTKTIVTKLAFKHLEDQTQNHGQTGLFALELYNEENIFFCNNDNICLFFNPDYPCTETLNYYSVNGLTGEYNYIKYIGGDATYMPLDIIALPDNSSIMFLSRYETGVNIVYELDTYVIKFDAEGNQVELSPDFITNNSHIKPLNVPVFDVLVYPNPTSDFLHFKTHLNKTDISVNIYNLKGKLIHQQSNINNPIELSTLNQGIYIYELIKDNIVVQSDEFAKD